MTKVRNKRHYSDDPEQLKFWAEELEFIGRAHRLDLREGCVIVYALPPRREKKRTKTQEARNKKAESAARRA